MPALALVPVLPGPLVGLPPEVLLVVVAAAARPQLPERERAQLLELERARQRVPHWRRIRHHQ
jgi:hypothetical protein